jgi:hypothetical protein
MENEIKKCLDKIKFLFPKSFINSRNELILEPKNNIYFRLEDIQTELEFKCKVVAWLSRPSCKGVSVYWQKICLKGMNNFLGTEFSKDNMEMIYAKLGNDVNRSLTIRFIESGYDLTVLGYKDYSSI